MPNKKRAVSFPSETSESNFCICTACNSAGKVIRLKLPETKYFDGKKLSTVYRNYWLCRNCRDKLVKALEWGEEDGK